jgi:hypothetical protein
VSFATATMMKLYRIVVATCDCYQIEMQRISLREARTIVITIIVIITTVVVIAAAAFDLMNSTVNLTD